MQLIVESKPLAKLVMSIAERGVKLDSDIHLAACSVLAHTAAHRNKTLIGNLVDALPKSARRKALIDWFEAFGPYKIGYINAAVVMPKADTPEWIAYTDDFENTIEKACLTPFWMEKETGAKDKKAITMAGIIEYLNKKAKDKQADADTQNRIAAVAKFATELTEGGGQYALPLSNGDTENRPSVH